MLHEEELSPADIADALGVDVKAVSDHLRQLYDAGCVEFVGRGEGEGNLNRVVYRAIARPFISGEEYRAMSVEERDDFNGVTLQWILAECLTSYRSGRMNLDEHLCLISDVPNLDLVGRQELHDYLIATLEGDPEAEGLEGIQAIAGRATNRIADSTETGSKVAVVLMAFERGRTQDARSKFGVGKI
jgi:DNA-binding transcriptional ArsR family regulator